MAPKKDPLMYFFRTWTKPSSFLKVENSKIAHSVKNRQNRILDKITLIRSELKGNQQWIFLEHMI